MSRHEGDPATADPARSLASALQELRLRAGNPSIRAIAKEIGTVSHTTVAEAINGRRVPSWHIVESIVRQLDGDLDEFQPLWARAVTEAAPPAGDQRDFLAKYRRNVAIYLGSVGSSYVRPDVTPDGGTERVDLASAMADAQRLSVLGVPGSGKTTACHALMYQHAMADDGLVPFLVPLHELSAEPRRSIVDFIEQRLDWVFQCPPPRGAVPDILRRGSALVMFDGLDDVRGERVVPAIELFCVEYADVRVVVTARPAGYDPNWFARQPFPVFHLESFADEHIRRLADRRLPEPDEFLRDTAFMADARTNPAFLARLLHAYQRRGALPVNWAEVYGEFFIWSLSGDPEIGRGNQYFAPSAVGHLAFWLLTERNDQPAATLPELTGRLADYLRPRLEDENAKTLSEFLVNHSGLLRPAGTTPDGERLYGFAHRTFLEYGAATHLAATTGSPQELARDLAERLAEPQWVGVGLFAVLIVDRTIERGAERIIRVLLDETGHRPWLEDFLRQCAELTYLPPALSHRLSTVDPPAGTEAGYRGPAACQIAGVTYRQLDYWARTGLVPPSIRPGRGSSSQRLYSVKDILILKVIKRLLDTGVSLQNIRVAADHLRRRDIKDLTKVTLFSDGQTVYETTSPEEIIELLQGGQGVFGIAVSGALREINAAIDEFPAEMQEPPQPRRRRRVSEVASPEDIALM